MRRLPVALVLTVAVLIQLVATASATVAGRPTRPPAFMPRGHSADLARALGADGTFRGATGISGTVDKRAWTLVSGLSAGEPPRFATASAVSPAAAGPWSALGSNGGGNGALNGTVLCFAVSGTNLYVGGDFTNAAGIPEADYVAKWNGSAWSALGSNGSGNGALNGDVNALAVSGTSVYVGGLFSDTAGIAEADNIAKWDGGWSALGSNGSGDGAILGGISALAVSGNDLYVGGFFSNATGIAEADNIAKWNGSAWSAVGSNGSGNGAINAQVYALALSGSNLYVGGLFTDAAGFQEADNIALWNGSAWSALGSNNSGDGALNGGVGRIAISSTNVYVAGTFTDAATIATADYIAKWNGSGWSGLGSNGSGDGAISGAGLDALAIYGSDVYVGGVFTNAAGHAAADNVARWNGSAWSALGSNGSGNGALNGGVGALAVLGTGLYVGGDFTNVTGIATADFVARWGLPAVIVRKPDGRIKLGAGALVGNDIYNTTGASQSRTGSAAAGGSITFGISIQNDGSGADSFKVKATGSATTTYTVKYFRGATDISAAVVAGTYQTSSVAPAATYLITAKVTVKATAATGSSVTRLVTISSVGDGTKKDAVKFIGKRA
jgi:hypothetical protein